MHLRLNLEGVIAGHIHYPTRNGIRVAGYQRAMFSLCLPGPHYSYERLSTCAKNERTACHEYIRSLSPALRAAKDEEFTLQEFLTICRQDRSAYANAAERLLMAIGEPVMVDTALEPRLSVSFQTGLSHAIRHLKSFTVWKTPLSRSFPTSSMPPGAGREETDPLSAGAGGRW